VNQRRVVASAVATVIGAVAARAAYRGLNVAPPGGTGLWERKNHRGEPVTLLEGPAYVAAAAGALALAPGLPLQVRTAGVLAAAGAGALGAYDDLSGSGDRRGFKGHLSALAQGQVTTGAAKIVGIGATGLLAGALVRDRLVDKVLAGAVVAGTANLVNLLDLRPGRAVKVGLLLGVPVVVGSGPAAPAAAVACGAGAALLPEDLGERAMLGDAGANAMGAVLGVAAVAWASRPGLVARVAALVALTLASEKVSFSKVIDQVGPLRALDQLGRRPAGPS
jgi:UDP-GlcNAc:undecaprenyl-phosphate/decaprenyl-phosphate GlcNAc-1-phosphate transferase